jgi:hypothetical protein
MEKDEIEEYFYQLVLGLQSSAWMLLGKIANPMTGEVERNLEGAKATIDTLRMLKEKSKGNLTKEEDQLLTGSISQLEINYIAEAKKDKENKSEEKKPKIETGSKKEHDEDCSCEDGHEHECGCGHSHDSEEHEDEPETDVKWDKK